MKTFLGMGLVALAVAMPAAYAQETSPVGLWKNIDDVTGKPKALIRISESRGELHGQIEKLYLAPGEDPNPRCDKCSGDKKDQPVLGMVFMSGLKKDGSD